MNKRHILLLFYLLFLGLSSSAQRSIGLVCRPMQDSIMLRWAPSNPEVWRLGNQYGYRVMRYTILRDKKVPQEIDELLLTPKNLKPAPLEQWEPLADCKYIGIAAECIYSSVFREVPTGGNPHIAYKKYREEQQRFSFAVYAVDQSLTAAKLSGLYYSDKRAKPNEKYLYRVYINCPDSLAEDTAYVFTGQSAYRPLPKPLDVRGEWMDHKVLLSWDIKSLHHIYNSYVVERSMDQGKHYNLLDSNAIVQMSDEGVNPMRMYKSDSLPDNKTLVCYRIRGINAFGQTGPYSDILKGKGQLPLKKGPVIVSNEVIQNKTVVLEWEYPDEMNDYIMGFKIYRSSSPKSRKKLIFKGRQPEQRIFRDTTAGFNNYYLISVYNQRKEKLSPLITYAARVDSFPPEQPKMLAGHIDSTGHVLLSWQSNPDSDLKGYRVYKSNHPDFEYLLQTPSVLEDTVFHDSINIKTLTREVYYKIKAVDIRQNMSVSSPGIKMMRPDVIPPVAPLFKAINDIKGVPQLQWVNSSSKDVVKHHVFRKEKRDSISCLRVTLPVDNKIYGSYIDKSVEAGKIYVYYIVAEDSSGLRSPSSKTMLFKVPSGIVETIKLKRRLQTDKVKLTWSITSGKSVEKILVYRSVNHGPLQLYGNTTQEVFYDNRLSPQKHYEYAIKAIYVDGSSSQLSKAVVVRM